MNQQNPLSLIWDILIIILATALGIFTPVQLQLKLMSPTWARLLSLCVSVFFACDILITLYKIRKGRMRRSFGEPHTKTRYFRQWFVFDLLAAIPFNLIPGLYGLSLLRLTKLVRVGHIMYVWRHLLYRFQNQLGIFVLLYWMILGIHWLACGWLAIRGVDTQISVWANYTDALYWCVTTITTVGFGDITPDTLTEKWYTIWAMILGLAFSSYFIGYVASKLLNRDPASTLYYENLDRLSQIITYRGLPGNLQSRIYDYYTYIWRKQTGYFEADFLQSLPPGLKMEVSSYLKKEIVEKVSLFEDLGEDFLDEISMMLESRIIAPGERVVKFGDTGEKMFFIVRGTLDVLNAQGEVVAQLTDGDFFGEISLFLSQRRTAEIRAIDYCDVYTLSKHSLDIVTRKFPAIKTRIEQKIEARIANDRAREEDSQQ